MSEITRKKHTGEPGNGGEFGTVPHPGSGLTLAPVDAATIDLVDLDRMAAHGEVARRTAVALRGVRVGRELTAVGITSIEVTRHPDGTFYVSEAVDTEGQVHEDDEFLLGRAEGALTRSRLPFEDLRLLSVYPSSTTDTIALDPSKFEDEPTIKAGFAARDQIWRNTAAQDLPRAS